MKKGQPRCGAGLLWSDCPAGSGVLSSDEIPVDQIPERLDVLGAGVAVIDVISVFPHIAGQQGCLTGGHRRAGVAGAH